MTYAEPTTDMDNRKLKTENGKRKARAGFTLIETLVAASIFVMLTTVAVGAFVQALKSQRFLLGLMSLSNNVGSAIEQIGRELRTGYGFCPGEPDPLTPCDPDRILNIATNYIDFVNYEGASVTVSWKQDPLTGRGFLARAVGGGTDYPVTAEDIDVTAATFLIRQAMVSVAGSVTASPCAPWRVTIALIAPPAYVAAAGREVSAQTTVSARVLPFEAPNVPSDVLDLCRGAFE